MNHLQYNYFSQQVEDKLLDNSAYHEAHFVKLVRNWYNACDSRGMPADERVNKLWAFYAYLTNYIDFDRFPDIPSMSKGFQLLPMLEFCRTFLSDCHCIQYRNLVLTMHAAYLH